MGLVKWLVHKIAHEKIGRGRGIVRFERESLGYRSAGLAQLGHPEVEAFVSEESLVDEAGAFVKFVVDYILTKSARIKPGETFEYGFWLVRFVLTSAGRLAAWDLRPGTTNEFVPNVDLAVGYCHAQIEVCAQVGGTDFLPPGGDDLAGYDDAVWTARRLTSIAIRASTLNNLAGSSSTSHSSMGSLRYVWATSTKSPKRGLT